MSNLFINLLVTYFQPIGNIVTYNPKNQQIIINYNVSDEDIINMDLLAKKVGLEDPMYYEYIGSKFILHIDNKKEDNKKGNNKKEDNNKEDNNKEDNTLYYENNGTNVKSFSIPEDVKQEAKIGLTLHDVGYSGGTDTGYNRALQLQKDYIDIDTLRVIRNWFARHFYVSRAGYLKWIKDGRPTNYIPGRKNIYRGAIAWLIWGGDSAYKWVTSLKIQNALNQNYTNKDNTLPAIN